MKNQMLCVFTVMAFGIGDVNISLYGGITGWVKKIIASEKNAAPAAEPKNGPVYYFESMATNANTVPEHIAGEKFIEVVYSKFTPSTIRQTLQKIGTELRVSTVGKDADDIKKFIVEYHLDMTDYNKVKPEEFEDFNDFFYRTLKPQVRKIDTREFVVTSPVDSKLRVLVPISPTAKFFIKQDFFNLKEFLHDELLAAEYTGGTLLVFRLAPTDYHRFHFPFACTSQQPLLIDGEYETVSPIAFQSVGLWPISINKRVCIHVHSPVFGKVIMMVVGASMVGSLNFVYQQMLPAAKGDEAGFFAFGGSTICLLFKKDTIIIPDVLIARSNNKRVAAKPQVKNPSAADDQYEKETAFETAVLMGQGVAMKAGSANVNGLSDPAYIAFLSKANKNLTFKQGPVEVPFGWNSVAPAHGVVTY